MDTNLDFDEEILEFEAMMCVMCGTILDHPATDQSCYCQACWDQYIREDFYAPSPPQTG